MRSLLFVMLFLLYAVVASGLVISVMHLGVIIGISITVLGIFLLRPNLIQHFFRTLYKFSKAKDEASCSESGKSNPNTYWKENIDVRITI